MHIRFWLGRLRSMMRQAYDKRHRIDERCESCRVVLVVDDDILRPYVLDNDGVPLCLLCAEQLEHSSW